MKKDVKNCFSVECIGSSPAGVELDPNLSTINASVTVYTDGIRDVGCTFLGKKLCDKFGSARKDRSKCVHLYPKKTT